MGARTAPSRCRLLQPPPRMQPGTAARRLRWRMPWRALRRCAGAAAASGRMRSQWLALAALVGTGGRRRWFRRLSMVGGGEGERVSLLQHSVQKAQHPQSTAHKARHPQSTAPTKHSTHKAQRHLPHIVSPLSAASSSGTARSRWPPPVRR